MANNSDLTDEQVLADFENYYQLALGHDLASVLLAQARLGQIRVRIPNGGSFAGRGFSMFDLKDMEATLNSLRQALQALPSALGQRATRVVQRLDGPGGFN